MNGPLGWQEICRRPEYRGRWVALDNVRYDNVTSKPLEGEVVDADDDLAVLCARMRSTDRTSCAIAHCDDDESMAYVARVSQVPPPRTQRVPRASQH